MKQNQTPLRKARLALGLTTTEAGHYVNVTRKTWEAWEALEAIGKPVPRTPAELFFNKLENLGLQKEGLRDFVVVLLEDPATTIQTPIDVVASDNYLGFEDAQVIGQKIIKSMAIDRITGRPYVHRTMFDPKTNIHVMKFCDRNKSLA